MIAIFEFAAPGMDSLHVGRIPDGNNAVKLKGKAGSHLVTLGNDLLFSGSASGFDYDPWKRFANRRADGAIS